VHVAKRELFISEIVGHYVESHPVDKSGMIPIDMVPLEVEAIGSLKTEI